MNYTELEQAIKSYLANTETDFVAQINTFIKAAEDKIFAALTGPIFWKADSTQTFSASVSNYTMPDGTIDVLDIHVHGPSSSVYGRNLLRKDHSFLREAFPIRTGATTRGLPKFYCVQGASLNSGEPTLAFRVAPEPDATYTYTVSYYGKSAADSITDGNTPGGGSTDVTWLSVAYPEVLLTGSVLNAYIYMKGEPDVIETYRNQFNESLVLLKNLSENRQDTDQFSDLGKRESAT